MIYKSLTGSAVQNVEITKSCLGIAIIADVAFANEKLGWDYVTQGTQIMGTKPRKLTVFQEVDSNITGEGHANRQAALSDVVVRFSPFGELQLDATNSIRVVLSDLDPAKTYNIFLVEHPEMSTSLVKFENATLISGQSLHELINKNYQTIVIPDADGINEILMTYDGVDGVKVVNLDKEYIRLLSCRTSDIVVRTSKTQAIFGYDEHHLLDLSGVTKIEFKTDESEQQVFFIKSVSKEGGN